jgi:bacterioferritin-associated ferredoxin
MYVCLCNAITDHEIRQAAELGVTDLQGLKEGLGVATCCGTCESCACDILREATSDKRKVQAPQFA